MQKFSLTILFIFSSIIYCNAQDNTKNIPVIEFNYEKYQVLPKDMEGVYTWQDAKSVCQFSSAYGYDDWFLPSKYELNILYTHTLIIGGFSTGKYWSSTSINSNESWFQDFSNGGQYRSVNMGSKKVRCIRKKID